MTFPSIYKTQSLIFPKAFKITPPHPETFLKVKVNFKGLIYAPTKYKKSLGWAKCEGLTFWS